ncbi:MAG: hypothetical protein WBA74_08800 [Cyclobacteriaceae bacterium]
MFKENKMVNNNFKPRMTVLSFCSDITEIDRESFITLLSIYTNNVPKKEKKVTFYGKNNVIISAKTNIKEKNKMIVRGLSRGTKAFSKCILMDFQFNNKNYNIKMSTNNFHITGSENIERGEIAIENFIIHVREIKRLSEEIVSASQEERDKIFENIKNRKPKTLLEKRLYNTYIHENNIEMIKDVLKIDKPVFEGKGIIKEKPMNCNSMSDEKYEVKIPFTKLCQRFQNNSEYTKYFICTYTNYTDNNTILFTSREYGDSCKIKMSKKGIKYYFTISVEEVTEISKQLLKFIDEINVE